MVGQHLLDRREMSRVTEGLEGAGLGGDHAVGTGGAPFVEHQVDAVAMLGVAVDYLQGASR